MSDESPKAGELMILPYGFVLDWFMEEVVDREAAEIAEDDRTGQWQAKLTRNVTEHTLKHLVTYIKKNKIVFATEKPVVE